MPATPPHPAASRGLGRLYPGLLLVVLTAVAVGAQPAMGAARAGSTPVTQRAVLRDPPTNLDAVALTAAWQRFESEEDGRWRLTRDPLHGRPRILTGGPTRSYGAGAEVAAIAFVTRHRELLGLADPRHVVRIVESKDVRRLRRVKLQQEVEGIDVLDGTLVVIADGEGRIHHVASSTWPVGAIDRATDAGTEAARAAMVRRFEGDAPGFEGPPRRVVYPSGDGRLAYVADVLVGPAREPWRVVVDAGTGSELEARRMVLEEKAPAGEPDGDRHLAQGRRPDPKAALDPNDACDREWSTRLDASVTEVPDPSDPYLVDIVLGTESVGDGENDYQDPGLRAAGIKLLPCIRYKITVDYAVDTWGVYSAVEQLDVFLVNLNSVDFYWNLGLRPAFNHNCDTNLDTLGVVLPGRSWTAGANACGDQSICSRQGQFVIEYLEPDETKDVYLTVGMDRFYYSCTGWARMRVRIEAQSHIFDPNPVTTLAQLFQDQDDENEAVPCEAYSEVDLTNLAVPDPGEPWQLIGDFVEITDLEAPAVTYPTSREPSFPYLRRCDAFEAANAYHHLTQSQLYIQSLGFLNINNRRHRVDPHGVDGDDNSHYVGSPIGGGFLAFGEGGVDDAEDADVVLHEYGHSIQDNQTMGVYFGTGGNGFGDETGAMGEGFGDYWGCSHFAAASAAAGFDPAAWAEWDAVNLGGLRRVDVDKEYPVDMTDEVHADGEIWSRALWQLFAGLGKGLADVLVLESHFLVPNEPRFTDGAKAILAADLIETGGLHEDLIIDAFVARGIFRELSVQSVSDGAAIEVSTPDCRGDLGAAAPFDRVYAWGETLTLTAPALHAGDLFMRWEVDGAAQPAGVLTAQVVLDHTPGAHTAVALYDTTSILAAAEAAPREVTLGQNHPNPFRATTTIRFGLPAGTRLEISVYDVGGRLARTLRSGWLGPGYHTVAWDGRDAAGAALPPGVYLCRLRAGDGTLTRRMVLLE